MRDQSVRKRVTRGLRFLEKVVKLGNLYAEHGKLLQKSRQMSGPDEKMEMRQQALQLELSEANRTLAKDEATLGDLVALIDVLGPAGLELALGRLAPRLTRDQIKTIAITLTRHDWIEWDKIALKKLDLSKVSGTSALEIESSLANVLMRSTDDSWIQAELSQLIRLADELTRGEPEATDLDAYAKRALTVQNWVNTYRDLVRGPKRTAIRSQLMARTPESQRDLFQKLRDLGESGKSLVLEDVHKIVVVAKPQFATPIGDLIRSGVLDPLVPIQPSTSTPGSASEPAQSPEHFRST